MINALLALVYCKYGSLQLDDPLSKHTGQGHVPNHVVWNNKGGQSPQNLQEMILNVTHLYIVLQYSLAFEYFSSPSLNAHLTKRDKQLSIERPFKT